MGRLLEVRYFLGCGDEDANGLLVRVHDLVHDTRACAEEHHALRQRGQRLHCTKCIRVVLSTDKLCALCNRDD